MPEWWEYRYAESHRTCEVDDVEFAQPLGFIRFHKPRYRVKAGRRVVA